MSQEGLEPWADSLSSLPARVEVQHELCDEHWATLNEV